MMPPQVPSSQDTLSARGTTNESFSSAGYSQGEELSQLSGLEDVPLLSSQGSRGLLDLAAELSDDLLLPSQGASSSCSGNNNSMAPPAAKTPPPVPLAAASAAASNSNLPPASQDVLTQNHESLTQLSQDESSNLLACLTPPPASNGSPDHQHQGPWGRLVPIASQSNQISLDFKWPDKASPSSLRPGDILNEYTVGRSERCHVVVPEPTAPVDPAADETAKREYARLDYAFRSISNRHCRIFCMVERSGGSSGAAVVPFRRNLLQVYVEDTSGNGTLINRTTLLRRGQRRQLHSGDEICLVNPHNLGKKIRSQSTLNQLLQRHAYLFVNLLMQQPAPQAPSDFTLLPVYPVASRKRAAVNVRAMKPHSHQKQQQASNKRPRTGSPSVFRSRPQHVQQQHPHRPRQEQNRSVQEDYDIRETLGSGTAGEVRRAIHRKTGVERAIKIITLRSRTQQEYDAAVATFQAETNILRKLEHPYIVQLVDVYISNTAAYLVMELVQGGELFDRICLLQRYSETQSRRVLRRLLSALHYLHESQHVVHRDLKPENILMTSSDSHVDIKLTDFGLAKSCYYGDSCKTFCGTPLYFAPEVLKRRFTQQGQGRYGKPSDMWSLGIILYVLLSGVPPFDVDDELGQGAPPLPSGVAFGQAQPTAAATTIRRIGFPAAHFAGVSDLALDLVRQLLQQDPQRRLTVTQACQHAWILQDDGDTHTHPLHDPKVQGLPVTATAPSPKRSPPSPKPPCSSAAANGRRRSAVFCTGKEASKPEKQQPSPKPATSNRRSAVFSTTGKEASQSKSDSKARKTAPSIPKPLAWTATDEPAKVSSEKKVPPSVTAKNTSACESDADAECAAANSQLRLELVPSTATCTSGARESPRLPSRARSPLLSVSMVNNDNTSSPSSPSRATIKKPSSTLSKSLAIPTVTVAKKRPTTEPTTATSIKKARTAAGSKKVQADAETSKTNTKSKRKATKKPRKAGNQTDSKRQSVDELPPFDGTKNTAGELSDDEIVSHFTNEGSSLSFHDGAATKTTELDDEHGDEARHFQRQERRKRRVTDSFGGCDDSKPPASGKKKTKQSSAAKAVEKETAPAESGRKAPKAAAVEEVAPAGKSAANKPAAATTKRKQMTLSSWFKKKK